MEIKIFFTCTLLAIMLAISAAWYDVANQTTTRYSDDGWIKYYTIPTYIRRRTRAMWLMSIFVFSVGCLAAIWM